MMVYGGAERSIDPRAELAGLNESWRTLAGAMPDPERQRALADLLIRAGMLMQAVLDSLFKTRGCDEVDPRTDACHGLLVALGRAYAGRPADVASAFAKIMALEFDRATACLPEGFVQYAVFPEQFLAAARMAAVDPAANLHVVGIRSIGTTLGAVVAGAISEAATLHTVRPTGHPFARELTLGRKLKERLMQARARAHYAIVDEGPGLSGSSFDSVICWLQARGVASERIHVLPSHDQPPGAMASTAVHARYSRTRRHFVPFEKVIVQGMQGVAAPLESWFVDLTSAPTAFLDLSGGKWREFVFSSEAEYPATHIQQERRKYLLQSERGAWLFRFLGLVPQAQALLSRAHALSDAGFTTKLLAVRHGMSVSPWLAARPLTAATCDRTHLVQTVARYLTFIARNFSAPGSASGADPARLMEMTMCNVGELLGSEAAAEGKMLLDLTPALRARARPAATDNKLDAHEWLVAPDGRVFKSDALDHHLGHDLIGCQDPAWDVAGATVELGLDDAEQDGVLRVMRDGANFRILPRELAFYELSYLAFRAGHAHLAWLSLHSSAPSEAARMARALAGYKKKLTTSMARLSGS
jgi:hypothetical protein